MILFASLLGLAYLYLFPTRSYGTGLEPPAFQPKICRGR